MTAEQRRTLRNWGLGILGTLISLALITAFKAADRSKLDTIRFIADSARRDRDAAIEDRQRDADRDILIRLDARVGKIYCGRLPDSLRAGCE